MGGIFGGGKPKKVAPPPVPPPAPIPEVAPETEDWAMRGARRRKGFMGTVITGALEPAKRKRTVLGQTMNKCKDCRFEEERYCKRHAPIIVLDKQTSCGLKDTPFTRWPIVYDDNWCGDFEKKEERKR